MLFVRSGLIMLLLLLIQGCHSNANAPLEISDRFERGLWTGGPLNGAAILDGAADDILRHGTPLPAFGDAVSVYLFRAHLPAGLGGDGERLIELPYPLLDRVDFWVQTANGERRHYRAGALYRFDERAEPVPDIVFPLPASDQPIDVAFTIQTSSVLLDHVLLWDRTQWETHQDNAHLWYGTLIGAISALLLYNLFLALSLRDSSYLYYALYLTGVNLMNLVNAGYLDAHLWPDRAGVSASLILSLIALPIISIVLFINRFLDVRHRFPRLWRWSLPIMLLAIPPVLPDLLGMQEFNAIAIPVLMLLSHLSMLYAIGIAILGYRAGILQARFVIVALSVFYIGVLVYELFLLGLLPYHGFFPHALEVASLTEALLLALALADRINLLRRQMAAADRQAMAAQENLSHRLIEAEEQERERVAGVLHDSIGHGLLVLRHGLEASPRQHEDDRRLRLCDELIDDVRALSHDLHPHLLKRLGFKAAIESTLARACASNGLDWQADVEDLPRLPAAQEITLFRAIQEGLNNILKHADASEVLVSLRRQANRVIAEIKDDGQGFDPTMTGTDGLGLQTLRGRFRLFHGRMEIHSAPGEGTHLILELPLPESESP